MQDGWKILGALLALFSTFTSVTTAIVSLNVRLTSLEKDVKANTEDISEQREFAKQRYPNYPYNRDGERTNVGK